MWAVIFSIGHPPRTSDVKEPEKQESSHPKKPAGFKVAMCVGGSEMVWVVNASQALEPYPGYSLLFRGFYTIHKSPSGGQDVKTSRCWWSLASER